jgi:hypothetical protein
VLLLTLPSRVTILHNSSSPHALPIFAAELAKAQYRVRRSKLSSRDAGTNDLTGDDTDDSLVYEVVNKPLPLTSREEVLVQTILSLFVAIFVLVPFCYIPASFGVFVVKERAVKAKHLQMVSGVRGWTYWLATYLWDMSLYCIIVCGVSLVFARGFDAPAFTGTANACAATFLLMFLYGTAAVPLSYCYSFSFDNHSTAQIAIMGLNFISGFVMVMANFIMMSLPKTQAAAKVLVEIYRFLPPYDFVSRIQVPQSTQIHTITVTAAVLLCCEIGS